jgi:hypothetical protein
VPFLSPVEADEVDGIEERVDAWSAALWPALKQVLATASAPATASLEGGIASDTTTQGQETGAGGESAAPVVPAVLVSPATPVVEQHATGQSGSAAAAPSAAMHKVVSEVDVAVGGGSAGEPLAVPVRKLECIPVTPDMVGGDPLQPWQACKVCDG